MGKLIDMTGWRMSEHGQPDSILTVLQRDFEYDKIRAGRPIKWICQCDCGNIKSIVGSELKRKGKKAPTLSCGCLWKERTKHFGDLTRRDLKGQKFGLLTPLEVVGRNSYNYNIWRCKCDCGNEINVGSNSLLSGNTISCGCKKNSYREHLIEQELKNNNISFVREYSFKDLKDKALLRFDFALFKNNILICLIEHQGRQHTKDIPWHTEKLQLHDNMKKEYCNENNISLYEIQYKDDIKQEIEKILIKEKLKEE